MSYYWGVGWHCTSLPQPASIPACHLFLAKANFYSPGEGSAVALARAGAPYGRGLIPDTLDQGERLVILVERFR